MSAPHPFLFELFTEELPPKALKRLASALGEHLFDSLRRLDLVDAQATLTVFGAPRHLGARIDAVREHAPERLERLKGPSVKVGLDDAGQPTMALKKWAEKQGVAIDALERDGEGKAQAFYAERRAPGARLADVVGELVQQALDALPVPKMMQYQLADGRTTVGFVRPVHRVVALHGREILPLTVLGLPAGRITEGHRFHRPGEVAIDSPADYERALEQACVLADFDRRRAEIDTRLRAQAQALSLSLGESTAYEALLDEVTALVEWPAVYVGRFEDAFLQVPAECLILTMRTNQKYFPLFAADGALSNRFLICSNMRIEDPSNIIDGNERVVRPRLADARFFFEQDRRQPLAARLPRLASVIYHARLGTQAERSERVRRLARAIGTRLGLDADALARCERAATLAKTDLLTDMVGEFPELQGIMGTYYARHDGEADDVALAMQEQYRPRFAGDALPETVTGSVLALADKLETLAGLFSIGQLPTGDKDPFALRRHALGVLRILIEKALALPLDWLQTQALSAFDGGGDALAALRGFCNDRLVGLLREAGHAPDVIAAITDAQPAELWTLPARLQAVSEFRTLPQAQSLAAANKRIGNILRKAPVPVAGEPESALLREPAEQQLAQALSETRTRVDNALDKGRFGDAMTAMAALREPVDAFFDGVMVMADDPALRDNRLRLLSSLHGLMNSVADISRLAQ
ncbi:MAG: glycine--tRNA ligase subunit beta [Burkholderiaceae bacterium]